ncbi:TolC family protein [Mucilaginibacter gilvus]|uniref:TolC family protein n=2 Tax=Mucilaginibacter gilvus TaxID=2305909 RepID=A0A444MJL1_9SPHI|nr:TolC family protein [Mucilaginibacter gilvus]
MNMKKKHQIIYMLLASLLSLSAKAQVQRLSLDSVLSRITFNPSLISFDQKINAEDAYVAGAKSLEAPKISAGQYQTNYQPKPYAGWFMIYGEQTFTNPAKLRAKEAYLKGVSKVTVEDKNYLKNQLIAQARLSYYDRVVLEKKLTLLQSTQGLLEYMLKDANIKLTYGKEKLNNIYKAKADLYQLDNIREQLNNEIRQKNILLNTLMNRDKQTEFMIDTTVTIMEYELTITDTARLVSSRSDIKGISRSIELQQLNADAEYSKRKPDFGIQAAHMIGLGNTPSQYTLMGVITIPIVPWASKEYKANLKGIRFEQEALAQKKADLLNQAEGQLAGLKAEISSKKRQLTNYRQNIIPAQQNSYKTALQAYEQNTGDLPSVLNGIKDLQAAKMEQLDRLQELLQLQIAYQRENEQY